MPLDQTKSKAPKRKSKIVPHPNVLGNEKADKPIMLDLEPHPEKDVVLHGPGGKITVPESEVVRYSKRGYKIWEPAVAPPKVSTTAPATQAKG